MTIAFGQLLRHAQRHAARNDRYLVHRIGIRNFQTDERVAGFVISGDALLFVRDDHALALGAHQHFVFGQLEVGHRHNLLVVARRVQRRFVNQVGEVRAGESRSAARDHADVNVFAERNLARVNFQNAFAAAHVRSRYDDTPIKSAGSKQRRIQNVRTVGRSDQNHAVVRFKAIHLNQQLIQSLFALVVTAAETGAAMTADRVDLIDEDDAGRILLALLEQVAHARGADADKHLDEVRTRNRKERHVRFAGNRARQQGLAGSRRAHHQNAFGNAAAELLKLLRFFQELNDFLQFFLGFFNAGDVFEGHALLLIAQQLCARLAKRKRLVAARLHLPQHENPETEDQQERQQVIERRPPIAAAARFVLNLFDSRLAVDCLSRRGFENVVLGLLVGELNVIFDVRWLLSMATVSVCLTVNCFQLLLFDFLIELRQIDILGVLAAGIDQLINQQRARDNQQPEDDLSCSRTQSLRFLRGRSYLKSAILVRAGQPMPLLRPNRLSQSDGRFMMRSSALPVPNICAGGITAMAVVWFKLRRLPAPAIVQQAAFAIGVSAAG